MDGEEGADDDQRHYV